MRKHIDYYYKCYDKQNENGIDKICNERFNEYGYNFDSNSKKTINYDEIAKKTNYQNSRQYFEKKK